MRFRRGNNLRPFLGLLVAAVVLAGLIAHVPRGRGLRRAVHHGYWSHIVRIQANRQNLFPAVNPSDRTQYRPQLDWRPLCLAAPAPLPRSRFTSVIQLRAPPRSA
jgi:hypothetical protein